MLPFWVLSVVFDYLISFGCQYNIYIGDTALTE